MTTALPAQIKQAFTKLGQYMLSSADEEFKGLIRSAQHHNAWFTPAETERAVKAIGEMLNESDLSQWLEKEYTLAQSRGEAGSKIIGLVLAGNIPLVGFHDILCVLASGHTALIKLSSQDKYLTPFLLKKLSEFDEYFASHVQYTERLENFDAVIATGSNNTSRYFDYYFRNVPHIIRKNRNSIAILTGSESRTDLEALGNDIFNYFGLGCRNVSKLFVPVGYDFVPFFEAIESFKEVINHHKYSNNYDYNKSIYLVNREAHLDNGFLLLRQSDAFSSPLAALYYEEYSDLAALQANLAARAEEIQCVLCGDAVPGIEEPIGFGNSQQPRLWDYADGVNTMQFLLTL